MLCPQVMEHLMNPKQALEELSRISRKGYIETPKPIEEIAHPASYHKWFVKVENKQLKFIEKKPDIFNIGFNENLPSVMKRTKKYRGDFYTKYQYHDSIDFEIKKTFGKKRWISAKNDNNYNLSTDLSSLSLSEKIGRKLINKKKNFDIYEILACQICKKNLNELNNNLICNNCNKEYPIIDDVPILLKEKARDM